MSDILTIAENERRFVAKELHDHVIQTLLQVNMQVSICKRFLELGHVDEAAEELEGLEAQTLKASNQIRSLIADLRPLISVEEDFAETVQRHIERHHERGGPPITLTTAGDLSLNPVQHLAMTRILQEILSNIRQHAQANQVTLEVRQDSSQLSLFIADDGQGFGPTATPSQNSKKGGTGLETMKIRAKAINGQIDIQSEPATGTTIKVVVKL